MSAQRRVHPHPVVPVPRCASRTGAARRPRPDRARRGHRRDRARHQGHRPRVQDFQPALYRALGAEDIRHRRAASEAVLMRRLLSLDYVLEHPDLPWLPTESEKVGAFEALGIERRILPSRLYRGAAGNTRRYFPLKLPVALEAERALFVYVEPGHDTSTALRSWGEAHLRPLAGAQRARPVRRGRGRRPHSRGVRSGPGDTRRLGRSLRPGRTGRRDP